MATPQSIRYLNEVQVLDALLQHGAMSRAELARRVGLNRSSMGSIIAGLTASGMVRERAQTSSMVGQVGRPGIAVEINPHGGAFIGVEIGVERLAACVVDLNAEVIGSEAVLHATPEVAVGKTIKAVAKLVRALVKRFDLGGAIGGLGVAVPALVDKTGLVLNGLLLGWRDVPLRELLVKQLGDTFPIEVENDANAFAIAETGRNPALLSETVAFLRMENGVGGSLFDHGKLFRGGHGHAGEFGHLLVNGKTATFGRSLPHHLESHIGKDAVLAQYCARKKCAHAGMAELLAAIDQAEPAAVNLVQRWGNHIAYALSQISAAFNPHRIVLGGSVASLFTPVADRVLATMRSELLDGFTLPAIEVSALGAGSTPLGAALMMHRHFFSLDEQVLSGARLSA